MNRAINRVGPGSRGRAGSTAGSGATISRVVSRRRPDASCILPDLTSSSGGTPGALPVLQRGAVYLRASRAALPAYHSSCGTRRTR